MHVEDKKPISGACNLDLEVLGPRGTFVLLYLPEKLVENLGVIFVLRISSRSIISALFEGISNPGEVP